MRFVKDDASRYFDATWYFAKPGALPFPGVHRFGSANWDNERHQPSDLGDDATRRQVWSDGLNVNRSEGKSFAGPFADFVVGAPFSADLPRGSTGTPVECLRPPFGLALGGLCVAVNPVSARMLKGGTSLDVTPEIYTGGLLKSGNG